MKYLPGRDIKYLLLLLTISACDVEEPTPQQEPCGTLGYPCCDMQCEDDTLKCIEGRKEYICVPNREVKHP